MKCKIDCVERVDSEDQIHWIELKINDQVFEMDRQDVWELLCIANTVFDRMFDVGEAMTPLLNRERVMKLALK